MEQLLAEEQNLKFLVTDKFASNMLIPIIKNVLHKAETDWDDYNEVYHCCRLIELVRQTANIQMDFHYIKKAQDILGVALVTKGIIDLPMFFPTNISVEDSPQNILILNYFHTETAGRGWGEHWLKSIIFPYYQDKNFLTLYVKSSHPKVFSLYDRLGSSIGIYKSSSDNGLYARSGKIFKINLKN